MKYLAIISALLATSADGVKVSKKMSMYSKNKDPVARSSSEEDGFSKNINLSAENFQDGLKVNDHEDDFKPDEINSNFKAHVGFESRYDMENHDHATVSQDASRVGITLEGEAKTGATCMEGDWVVMNYQMYSQQDGTMIEDTQATSYPRPLIFQAGRYQVSKCLDIAVQQMRGGEDAVVYCPNDLDIGGGIQNTFHTNYGSTWLDTKIDTKYVISMSECSTKPSYFDVQKPLETLSEGSPFYIESDNLDADGNKMVLAVVPEDLYAPRTTGIHNVRLEKWAGRDSPDLRQQWLWNDENKSLASVGQGGSVLFEGFNKNMIVYKWKGLQNQRFKYNVGTERLENRFSGRAMDINNDNIRAGENVYTEEPDLTQGQKWKIVYHDKDHGHTSHD